MTALQSSLTFEDRVAALSDLGLSRVQTEFLVLVALHGGCFLRRQFDVFSGRRRGEVVSRFLKRLTAAGIVTPYPLHGCAGAVYHVQGKSIYRAIGQIDNRNRREVSFPTMARKVMLLDYVLAHEPRGWLATEHEKVELFTSRFGISRNYLPARTYLPGAAPTARTSPTPPTRHFIHKQPVRVTEDSSEVVFACLIDDASGARMDTFLRDHASLLDQLPSWAAAAVCPKHILGLRAAERVFSTFEARQADQLKRAVVAASVEDTLWFFRTKPEVDRGDLTRLRVPDLNRFRDLRHVLAGWQVERLFGKWLEHGDAVVTEALTKRGADPSAKSTGRLITYVLPFNYRPFGSLAGIA